jgi:hypothetical protein
MKYDLYRAGRGMLLAAAAMMLGTGTAVPAAAECAGASAIDACLVGAWKQTGGGPVEWMKRNMPPGMSVPGADQGERIIVLDRNGGFRTAPMSSDITFRMEGQGGAVRIEGGEVQASGRWSAANGKFHLCMETQKVEGQARVTVPGAGQQTMPFGQPSATGPMTLDYACSDDTLETTQPVPGMDDPITTRYARTEAEGAGQ